MATPRRKRRPATTPTRPRRRPGPSATALDPDDALIALLIGAMTASGHVSPGEAERADHIIWSMRRFRQQSGEAVGRRIDRMRQFVEEHGAANAIALASRSVPSRLRPAAYAVAADLVLVDGRMDAAERTFLGELAADLKLDRAAARRILDVMQIKNSA